MLLAAHVLATRPCSASQNAAGSKPATSRCSSASVALSVRLLPWAPAWVWSWGWDKGQGQGQDKGRRFGSGPGSGGSVRVLGPGPGPGPGLRHGLGAVSGVVAAAARAVERIVVVREG